MTTEAGQSQTVTQLQLGIVGPIALGKQSQNATHRVLGNDSFRGWNHQLKTEPLVNLTYDRSLRTMSRPFANTNWQWNAVAHGAGSIGNGSTYGAVGGELRIGRDLLGDFGSWSRRPQGGQLDNENARGWSGHAFLTVEALWVFRDITLDGNTFARSHRVERRAAVGELGYGISVRRGRLRMVLARFIRSREFETQRDMPAYGSLGIDYAF